jgi:mannosyltransferase OCH1-like enzyme
MKSLVFIILLILLIVLYLVYRIIKGRFEKPKYWNSDYIDKSKKLYLTGNKVENPYKNPLFQVYHTKSKIPGIVYENAKKFAPEYTHIVLDDTEIRPILSKYFTKPVLDKFDKLKGPHKADLARYCLLYLYGGLYLDIKTVLISPLSEIFKNEDYFYTVFANDNKHIYQGLIKTKANHPLFLSLIDFIINNPLILYHDYCRDMYYTIQKDVGRITNGGYFKGKSGNEFYIFKEKCSNKFDLCDNKSDRYGLCCNIFDGENKIIKTRFDSYPW